MSLKRTVRWLLAAFLSIGVRGLGADAFEEMVRSTAPLNPEEALKAFSVADGFEMQLVAAEPEIEKPISMSFDADGRLWIAETTSYPQPVTTNTTAGDSIRILSEFQLDGRPQKNQVFAKGLSMPDAVSPYRDGAVVFSVPNILFLRDVDGDGVMDQRETVYGPFGTRDHHNLANNFRRGFDGWMYGGQGVGNRSTIRGSDGHEETFTGASFRIRPDGTRIEKVGDGQANVFGLCFDPLGNLFTSDCHSMPIYQVIYGGFYPAFGKPHDGLGYAPQMLWHNHGSTAIAGLVEVHDPMWPAEFQGNFLLGNVVTCRVNRDRVEERGSTKIAVEMPDLVRTTDPWFRPVDVQLGPDGALYIADFYNRIIAHVEVSLDHPGRDKSRARIWRLVRRGKDGKPMLRSRGRLSALNLPQQVSQLGDPSFTHRLNVLNYLVDHASNETGLAVRRAMREPGADSALKVGGLWILERLGLLENQELESAVHHSDRSVRTHAVRVMVERVSWQAGERSLVFSALKDSDGFVVRAAADALSRHPADENVRELLSVRRQMNPADTHLTYQVRKALRDQLLDEGRFRRMVEGGLQETDRDSIADVALAVPSAESARFLATVIRSKAVAAEQRLEWVRHIARHGALTALSGLVAESKTNPAYGVDSQLGMIQALLLGGEQRGLGMDAVLRDWADELAVRILDGGVSSNRVQQTVAIDLIGRFRLVARMPLLEQIARNPQTEPGNRTAALRSLLTLRSDAGLPLVPNFLKDPAVPMSSRLEIVPLVARYNSASARTVLVDALREAPDRLGTGILNALCGSPEGVDVALTAVEKGYAPRNQLMDRSIRERIQSVRPQSLERLSKLMASVQPDSERLLRIAAERAADYIKVSGNPKLGEPIFQRTCVVCHSLGGKGGNVGPQLDGIGNRGLERLCEDVLNPSRNVDQVFRQTTIVLKDGDFLSGLVRREEGERLVLVDAMGKEVGIPKASVESKHELETSLMPENFAEAISKEEFKHLMAFLLSQRTPLPR